MEILIPILAVTVIGLICAVGLAVASSVMAVKEDTRFTEIRACLPGANCGACGYTGCDGYAKALLEPRTKTNLCVPARTRSRRKSRRCSAWRLRTWWKRSPSCSAPAPARPRASRPTTAASPPAREQSCSTAATAAASSAAWGFGDCSPGLPAERHLHAGRHRLRQPHRVHWLRHLRADLSAEDHRDRAGYHPHRGPLLELSQRPVHPQGLLLRLHRLP